MTEQVVAVPEGSDFPLDNLPLGIGAPDGERDRAWVAIGDHAVDLAALQRAGHLEEIGLPASCFADTSLNRFLEAGPDVWAETRRRLRVVASEPLEPAWLQARLKAIGLGLCLAAKSCVGFSHGWAIAA